MIKGGPNYGFEQLPQLPPIFISLKCCSIESYVFTPLVQALVQATFCLNRWLVLLDMILAKFGGQKPAQVIWALTLPVTISNDGL
jgi:hypothetical protein